MVHLPQVAGLGRNPTSRTYAIASLDEAAAYVADPVLGSRLIECARILTDLSGRTAQEIFGGVDAMKLRSSVTLFARARGGVESLTAPPRWRRARRTGIELRWEERVMAFTFRKDKAVKREHDDERSGGWYSDPYGKAARRWYDHVKGWSDRVEGHGEKPDRTGVQRLDDAADEAVMESSSKETKAAL